MREDERTVAFLNLRAFNPGYTLVVPRAHAADLASLDPEDAAAMFRAARHIGRALRSTHRAEGVNLWLNDGPAAGQDVFHVHLHVVPRHAGDGFEYRMPGRHSREVPRAELDETARVLREALAS